MRGGLAGARPWGRHATELASGVALVALSWLVLTDAATERVPGWEVDLFGAVNDLPDWLRWPIWPVMRLEQLLDGGGERARASTP